MVGQFRSFARAFWHPGIRDSIQAVIGGYQQKAAPPFGDAAHFRVVTDSPKPL